MYFIVCPLRGPGSITRHGRVFQLSRIFSLPDHTQTLEEERGAAKSPQAH